MINKEEKFIIFWVIMIYYYCFKVLNWMSTLSLEKETGGFTLV